MSTLILACGAFPTGIEGFFFLIVVLGIASAPFVAGALALGLAIKGLLSLI